MMYFLAIVNRRNLDVGLITPAYVLCQSKGKAKTRTGLRVVNQFEGAKKWKMPKVLVSSPIGHEDLIVFLSNYRTREHMHKSKWKHSKTKKYHPIGALFWFQCDKYGERNGPAIFIKRVPEKDAPTEKEAVEYLRNSDINYIKQKRTFRLNEGYMTLETSHVKAVLPQKGKKFYKDPWKHQRVRGIKIYEKFRRYRLIGIKRRKERLNGSE